MGKRELNNGIINELLRESLAGLNEAEVGISEYWKERERLSRVNNEHLAFAALNQKNPSKRKRIIDKIRKSPNDVRSALIEKALRRVETFTFYKYFDKIFTALKTRREEGFASGDPQEEILYDSSFRMHGVGKSEETSELIHRATQNGAFQFTTKMLELLSEGAPVSLTSGMNRTFVQRESFFLAHEATEIGARVVAPTNIRYLNVAFEYDKDSKTPSRVFLIVSPPAVIKKRQVAQILSGR